MQPPGSDSRRDVPSRQCRPADDPRLADVVAAVRALPSAGDYADKRQRVTGGVDVDRSELLARGFTIETIDVIEPGGPNGPGFGGELIVPPGSGDRGLLVTFHGGGYVVCSPGTHRLRFGLMGQAAGCGVLNVDYPLAPEHPFPAAVRHGVAAARWAGRRGPFVLAGDSAGGGLALAVALALRDTGGPVPAGVAALSPWTDLTMSLPSHHDRRARDPFAHVDDLPTYAALYLGGESPTHPLASPLFADHAGLPPLLVQVGSEETMFDDGFELARRAAAADVDVEFEEWIGMFHTWHAYPGKLHGADEAIASVGAFTARCLRS